MRRKVAVQLVVAFVITLAVATAASANGEDFFSVFQVDRPIELVYTGRVRDKVSAGRSTTPSCSSSPTSGAGSTSRS